MKEELERRYVNAKVQRVELRAEEEAAVIEGVSAVTDQVTSLGWIDEKIAPGAFDNVLKSSDLDCRCLFNHDSSKVLARKSSSSDTLELFIDENQNLAFRYETPNRTFAKDLADMIATGDVTQCSFGFTVKKSSWIWADNNGENDLRVIEEVGQLLDVGPVTYPAYKDTSVAKRSHDAAKKEIRNGQEPGGNSLLDALNARYKYNLNKAKDNGNID